ncbi:MAG: hypothetical protein BAA04_06500 [Firmicutes bacterium ZCTH02-B6]|nr:MAG: hypothetical protein BAA04_06500 [Firmicutes bacterium ZCTH02-B6]
MRSHLSVFRITLYLAALLVALYVVVPLLFVVLQSFNPRLTLWPEEFTLRWYQMRSGGLVPALITSFSVSVPATLIGVAVSIPLGLAMTRYQFRAKGLVQQMISLPIVVPGVALGLAYLQMVNSTFLRNVHPLAILIAVHTIIVIPYAARPIIAGFQALDRTLEEASATLGATPGVTFRKVVLPLLTSSVLSGAVLGFSRSLNDFIITLFLVQPGVVPLAVQVYQTTQYGLPQLTSALGTVLLLFSVAFTTVAERILRVEVEV